MQRLFRPLRPEWLALCVSLIFITLFNLPFWQRMLAILSPINGSSIKMLVMSFVLVTAFLNLLLLLLVWPKIGKPILGALLLTTAAITYFMSQYGVLIDLNMVRNALQTDAAEVHDLLTLKMVLTVLLLGGLPCWWLWKTPLQFRAPLKELGVRLVALGVTAGVLVGVAMVGYQDFSSLFRNHRELRFALTPTNYLQATSSYIKRATAKPQPLQRIAEDARRAPPVAGAKPKVLIVVVGETARADHFSLNGYARQTNPQLSKVPDLVNFPNTWSCGTETAVSVPCMFSALPRVKFDTDQAKHSENLLDVLARVGIKVNWRDNNSGCKSVCARVYTEMLFDEKDPKYCNSKECFDEILLDGLPARLKALRDDTVIVLHQKGSHGPAYDKRYPDAFRQFSPVCQTSELQKCSQAEIINAFDNTILYTDYFLSKVIATLQQAPEVSGSMLYLSDHGESLGEKGLYLHAAPYLIAPDAQKHIPMLAWFSPQWRQSTGLDQACLQKETGKAYSHDNLFHSVLGLMQVQTGLYEKPLDMFASCRRGATG